VPEEDDQEHGRKLDLIESRIQEACRRLAFELRKPVSALEQRPPAPGASLSLELILLTDIEGTS